jgi:hypothetical protein
MYDFNISLSGWQSGSSEHPPHKHEALSSNPNTTKKKKKKPSSNIPLSSTIIRKKKSAQECQRYTAPLIKWT